MDEKIYEGFVDYVELLRNDQNISESTETHKKYLEAVELLERIHKDELDAYDKEQRRIIENEKNQKTIEVELSKQKLTPGRVALDLTKVIVPALFSVGAVFVGLSFANDVEKEGRINTKFSNLVLNQIPKIWNGK